MRKINYKILKCLFDGKPARLSKRDMVYKDRDWIIYRLWNTDLARLHTKTGEIMIRNGGWHTPTTNDRLRALIGRFKPGWTLKDIPASWANERFY